MGKWVGGELGVELDGGEWGGKVGLESETEVRRVGSGSGEWVGDAYKFCSWLILSILTV